VCVVCIENYCNASFVCAVCVDLQFVDSQAALAKEKRWFVKEFLCLACGDPEL